MGSKKITLDSFSEDLTSFSKEIGDYDVSTLINTQKISLSSSLMIGYF